MTEIMNFFKYTTEISNYPDQSLNLFGINTQIIFRKGIQPLPSVFTTRSEYNNLATHVQNTILC